MEVVKGVHLINSYANTYILMEDRLVLVDTSSESDAKTILDYMAKSKMRPGDLATIFITHVHPDHVSGLARIKRDAPGAKVAASKIEAEYIAKVRTYDGPPGAKSQKQPGTPVDVPLEDGQAYNGLRAVYTPGHTRGSMSLLDETRSLLVAGDAASHENALGPMDDVYNVDPRIHRESIKKLSRLSFENAVFGHGTPIVGGASAQFVALAKRL